MSIDPRPRFIEVRRRPTMPAKLWTTLLAVLLVAGATPAAALATEALAMQAPAVSVPVGAIAAAKSMPVRVSWPVAPAAGGEVSHFTLQRRSGGGDWAAVNLPAPRRRFVVIRLSPWQTHQFRVMATYRSGAVTDWGVSEPLWLAHADESDLAVAYQLSWPLRSDRRALGRARTSSIASNASATYTFNAAAIGWVSARGPRHGRARVYLDDVHVATVDLRRARLQPRRVVFSATFPSAGPHTLRIDVEGTAGRPRVDVDGFVTLAPPATATLVGAGDIGRCGPSHDEQTAALIQAMEPAPIVYTTGDNAYPDGTASDFANCYEPSWGSFKSITRPSPGNHDNVYGLGAYFDYFGANAGPRGRGYYAYEAGTWRVYSLNSEACRRSSGWCGPGSAQYEWLRADLATNPHQCVLAYWHRPRFSSGYHGGSIRMRAITTLLHTMGADVVLVGHDHAYERFERMDGNGELDTEAGIRHFVVGTGGAALYAFSKPPLATTAVRQAHVHGLLQLDLQLGAYEWEFVPTEPDAFTDSGAATCH